MERKNAERASQTKQKCDQEGQRECEEAESNGSAELKCPRAGALAWRASTARESTTRLSLRW